MSRERRFPLRRMLPVRPRGAMGCPVGFGALGEGLGIGGLAGSGGAARLAGVDRGHVLLPQRAASARLPARVGEADGVRRPEPVVALATRAIAIDPPAAVLVCNTKIQPAAVVMPAGAEPPDL